MKRAGIRGRSASAFLFLFFFGDKANFISKRVQVLVNGFIGVCVKTTRARPFLASEPRSMKLVLALPLLVGLVSAAALPYQAVSVPSARSRARPHRGSTAPQQQQRYSAETVNLYNELFEAGRKQLDSDDPQGALPHFRKAASLAPDNSNAHANVGICLMRLGQTEDAIEAFERSEKQDPRQKVAVLKRAQLLDELGRIDEARQGFKRLMRLDPSDPWSYYHLAEYAAASAADSRERAEAPELYEQCVSRFQAKLQQMTLPAQSKQRGHFLETKGKCLMKLDRVDEALAELDAAIKFGNSFAHITRADFLGSQDRMLEAAEEYNKARVRSMYVVCGQAVLQ